MANPRPAVTIEPRARTRTRSPRRRVRTDFTAPETRDVTGPSTRSEPGGASRRGFLRTSSLLGAALAAGPGGSGVHAAGSGTIKVGLIGCGGRGTGAAEQAMNAGKDVKLVAMGDMFREQLDASRSHLRERRRRPASTWPTTAASSGSTPTSR